MMFEALGWFFDNYFGLLDFVLLTVLLKYSCTTCTKVPSVSCIPNCTLKNIPRNRETRTHTMLATPLRPEDFISKAEWRDNRGVKSPAHCQRACTWNTACEARIFGKFYCIIGKINHRAFEVLFLLDSGSTMHASLSSWGRWQRSKIVDRLKLLKFFEHLSSEGIGIVLI